MWKLRLLHLRNIGKYYALNTPLFSSTAAGTSFSVEESTTINIAHEESATKTTTDPANFDENNLPPPWENPWLYALGKPKPPPKYTEVEESKEDFKWVERLKPMRYIPDIPKHDSYPTPSGWRPPRDPPPDLPYHVRRNRRHVFSIFMEKRRDTLDTTTVEFNYVEIVVLPRVSGDIFACAKDLKEYLTEKLGHAVGVHVNEPQGKLRIKGADRSYIEQFLWEKGF